MITTINNKLQPAEDLANQAIRWSINGPDAADDASNVRFTLNLTGTFGAGESAAVNLGVFDVDPDSGAYSRIMTAIRVAVTANPDLSFDVITSELTYTSPLDSRTLLTVVMDLPLTDDGLINTGADFTLRLSNATTSTGKNVEIDPNGESATTTEKNKLPLAQWSITGLAAFEDLDNSPIVIGLTGIFDQGEIITVDLGLTYANSKRGSYTDILTAITISVAANPNLTFNLLTDKLTYTSPSNSASMADLLIELPLPNDDSTTGPEVFSLHLTNPTASTNTHVEVNPTLASFGTGTDDRQTSEISDFDPARPSITDPVAADKVTKVSRPDSPTDGLNTDEVIIVDDGITDSPARSDNQADLQTTVGGPVIANPSMALEPEAYILPPDGTAMTTATIDLQLTGTDQSEDTDSDNKGDLKASNSTDGYHDEVSHGDDGTPKAFTNTRIVASPGIASGLWSITGPAMVVEGDPAVFVVSLGGYYQIGESMSADINLIGIDTNSSGFTSAIAAIASAAETHPEVTFDGATLTFTASADRTAMTELIIALTIRAEAIKESTGLFSLGLSRATSNTNILTGITPGEQSIITCVNSLSITTVEPCHTTINTPITGYIPANFLHAKGNAPTVSLVNGKHCNATIRTAAGGKIVVNANGTYTYTPAVGFIGQDNIVIATRDMAGNFIEKILSVEVCNTLISEQTVDPSLAHIANNDCFSMLENDQQQSEFLIDESNPSNGNITPPDASGTDIKNTYHLSEMANRVTDLRCTNALESHAHPVEVPRAHSSPSDQAIVDTNPVIQPADGPQIFSTDKEVMGTSSTIEGDLCGKIVFNSKVSADVININVHDTIAAQSNKIRKYSATLKNGQSLPGWINFTQEGSFSIAKSIETEVLTLRLIALRDSGDRTTVLFEVNTLHGEIYLPENKHRPTTRATAVHA